MLLLRYYFYLAKIRYAEKEIERENRVVRRGILIKKPPKRVVSGGEEVGASFREIRRKYGPRVALFKHWGISRKAQLDSILAVRAGCKSE